MLDLVTKEYDVMVQEAGQASDAAKDHPTIRRLYRVFTMPAPDFSKHRDKKKSKSSRPSLFMNCFTSMRKRFKNCKCRKWKKKGTQVETLIDKAD